MLYFCRRDPEEDENKSEHNKMLRQKVYGLLLSAVRENGIVCEELPELKYNSYGKPYFSLYPDLHFNISHSRGMAVCAMHNVENGVDIEYIRHYSERVPRRAFSERERQILSQSSRADSMFFRIWTLKESYVKALGIGISYPLNTAEFLIDNDLISSNVKGDYHFNQILIGDSHVCSLCLKGKGQNSVFRLENEKEIFSFEL
ncbi:MAG: 4'-phosphopantetheinyl transferase family protein [Porcipelethomonas sp.]